MEKSEKLTYLTLWISLLTYADVNQVIESNLVLENLIEDMERKIEMMTKWLKDSGLTIN